MKCSIRYLFRFQKHRNVCHMSRFIQKPIGFTIVELLVVIAVIGVLAAISLIAYIGISQRAISSSLQADLNSASKQLKLFYIDNSSYPTSIDCSSSPAANSICLKPSGNNAYAVLRANNSTNPQTFCLVGMNNGISYSITNNTSVVSGSCNSTLTDGLVAYYPFNGDAKDYSGNGNDGVIHDATPINGVFGQAYAFNGTGDYISFPNSVINALQGKTEATIEFWCKKNAVQYGFMQLSGFASGNGNLYPYDTTTKVYLDTFKTSRLGPITMPISTLELHHFAITTSPGVDGWKLYQNGTLVYQTTGENTVSVNYLGFEIGRNSSARYADGMFDEVRIFNRALSAAEINAIYNL